MYLGAAILKLDPDNVVAQAWHQPAAATTRLGVRPNALCPVSSSSRNLKEIKWHILWVYMDTLDSVTLRCKSKNLPFPSL